MIQLQRLNKTPVFVNPDMIRFLEATPDTLVTFEDGKQMVVLEKTNEVVQKIVEYRRTCFPLPQVKGK